MTIKKGFIELLDVLSRKQLITTEEYVKILEAYSEVYIC